MRILLIVLSLFLAILIEGVFTSVPLVLVTLFIFGITNIDKKLLLAAFLSGVILDTITLQMVGISSLYFCIFLFIVQLYQKKFELYTFPFVFGAIFLGSFFYLLLLGYSSAFLVALTSSVISLIVFKVLLFFNTTKTSDSYSFIGESK